MQDFSSILLVVALLADKNTRFYLIMTCVSAHDAVFSWNRNDDTGGSMFLHHIICLQLILYRKVDQPM